MQRNWCREDTARGRSGWSTGVGMHPAFPGSGGTPDLPEAGSEIGEKLRGSKPPADAVYG